jgi:hypothetical protein
VMEDASKMNKRNRKKHNEYMCKYYSLPKNKLKKKLMDKKYREKNKEKISKISKIYRGKNKEKISKIKKIYAKLNKEKIRIYKNNWYNNKLKNDIEFKILRRIRNRIYYALIKQRNIKKIESFTSLVGTNKENLWKHLESTFKPGMTKENHGLWHIDHIKPCAAFNLISIKEQRKCFHYTNLQALWAKENLSKGAKY